MFHRRKVNCQASRIVRYKFQKNKVYTKFAVITPKHRKTPFFN